MKDYPSPNFNAREPNIALEYVVLHYTGMKDAASALARLCDPAAQVSAHYVIQEDGDVLRLVDEDKRAWHAGASFWRGLTDLNSASIGIELVNPGHEFGYRPFPKAQIAALTNLLFDIISRQKMSAATALLAHSDIAPTRKQDPGELFPWQPLAKQGLGLWPQPHPREDCAPADEDEAAQILTAIGYDITDFPAALRAFQRRYLPHDMTENLTEESVAKMRALKRLIGV